MDLRFERLSAREGSAFLCSKRILDAVGRLRRSFPLFAAAAMLAAAPPPPDPQIRFGERVDVERVIVDARVVDDAGMPLPGLGPKDFRLKVDGKVVPLESAYWVAAARREPEPEPPPEGATTPAFVVTPEPVEGEIAPGRLIVFFFQKDFEESRLTGLLRMQRTALSMVDNLVPGDRVAVVSFDHHLKLRLDFTSDPETLRHVIGNVMLLGDPRYIPPGPPPSLAEHFDRERARKAASPETALLVLADALKELPGPKTMIFVGWGMGRFDGRSGSVTLDHDYGPARRTLLEARVTVFCLDVTQADYHSLEVGLQQVAEDTGGFYARTHLFPELAMRRLEAALSGHYVLTFEKPRLRPGPHRVEVDLVGRKGTVLAKSSYEG
jgi:VWFA-related protein